MVARKTRQDAKVLKIFKKKKVLMIEELSGLLDSSLITARRRLKQWNAYTSYNQNRYGFSRRVASRSRWEKPDWTERMGGSWYQRRAWEVLCG